VTSRGIKTFCKKVEADGSTKLNADKALSILKAGHDR